AAGEVGGRQVGFNHGRSRPHRRVDPQAAVYLLGKAVRAADHLVGGAPRDALRGEPEGPARARVGEIDRDHDGHAERDAEDRETRLPGVIEEPAEARAPEHYAPSGEAAGLARFTRSRPAGPGRSRRSGPPGR